MNVARLWDGGGPQGDCAFALAPTEAATPETAGVALVHNPSTGGTELILAAFLPPVARFGPLFTEYGFDATLDGTAITGTLQECQVRPSGSIWTALVERPDLPPAGRGAASIFPVAADGRRGPVVLQGTADCTTATPPMARRAATAPTGWLGRLRGV